MKEELKNKLAYVTFVLAIISIVNTFIEFVIPLVYFGLILSIVVCILAGVCIYKKSKKVGLSSLIIGVGTILIQIVFALMYSAAN